MPEIYLPKSTSRNVTTELTYKPVRADMMKYHKDFSPAGFDSAPKITLHLAENILAFQKGIARLQIGKENYYIHIDAFMSAIYKAYGVDAAMIAGAIKGKRDNASPIII